MRITSWNCLCRDVSRRLSDLAPLHSDLITLQECRRALGVPVFGGVGPPVAPCATIAGRFVHLWPVREPRRTGGRCPATAAPGRRWCMNRNWPATILTQRLLTYRYRTTLARQGPSSDLGCCMRAAPRPFALLACALEGQCR